MAFVITLFPTTITPSMPSLPTGLAAPGTPHCQQTKILTAYLPFEAPASRCQRLLTPLHVNSAPSNVPAPVKSLSPLHPFAHASLSDRTAVSLSVLTHMLPSKAQLQESRLYQRPLSRPQQGRAPLWHMSCFLNWTGCHLGTETSSYAAQPLQCLANNSSSSKLLPSS